ncbi:MAG: ACS family MFS transporter [Luminiphilus sp.]|nr:ACS family MFS transporter [Luminiphilus sp.]
MVSPSQWPKRFNVIGLSFLAVFICYIDRVNISVAIIPMAEDLGWGMQQQGTVLSSFFVGYVLLQVIGGRLADRYGGKAVLGLGVVLWSFFTMLTPPAAALGFTLLILTRIAMGMGEAVTFPAIYSTFSKWVPLSERSRAVGFINSAIPLGTVFALLVTPIVVQHWGWPWAFYSFGAVGIVWFVFWQFMVSSSPQQHPGIRREELDYIELSGCASETEANVPWYRFLKSLPVWAIIVAHFCNNWSLFVLLSWMPTYINKGLGVDYASVGLLAIIPSIGAVFFLNIAGSLADRLIKGGMPLRSVRKLMQTIGFGGLTGSLLLVGHLDTVWMAITTMTVGSALGAFVTGGFAVNHMDIAPRHAGTLMGITNTAGAIPGIIGVFVTGLILELTGSWVLVFSVAGGVTFIGLAFYLLFASSEKLFD